MLDIVISKQKYMYLNLINSNIVLNIEKDLYFVSFMLKPRKKSPVVKKHVLSHVEVSLWISVFLACF